MATEVPVSENPVKRRRKRRSTPARNSKGRFIKGGTRTQKKKSTRRNPTTSGVVAVNPSRKRSSSPTRRRSSTARRQSSTPRRNRYGQFVSRSGSSSGSSTSITKGPRSRSSTRRTAGRNKRGQRVVKTTTRTVYMNPIGTDGRDAFRMLGIGVIGFLAARIAGEAITSFVPSGTVDNRTAKGGMRIGGAAILAFASWMWAQKASNKSAKANRGAFANGAMLGAGITLFGEASQMVKRNNPNSRFSGMLDDLFPGGLAQAGVGGSSNTAGMIKDKTSGVVSMRSAGVVAMQPPGSVNAAGLMSRGGQLNTGGMIKSEKSGRLNRRRMDAQGMVRKNMTGQRGHAGSLHGRRAGNHTGALAPEQREMIELVTEKYLEKQGGSNAGALIQKDRTGSYQTVARRDQSPARQAAYQESASFGAGFGGGYAG